MDKPSTEPTEFSGNPFRSITTIIFLAILAVFLYLLIIKPLDESLPFVFAPAIAYFMCGLQMNYFRVEGTIFTIKNSFFLWKTTEYDIDQIKCVQVKRIRTYRYTGPKGLLLYFGNGEKQYYAAGGFGESGWHALLNKLSSLGIAISEPAD